MATENAKKIAQATRDEMVRRHNAFLKKLVKEIKASK
jgi:hypothetical protein